MFKSNKTYQTEVSSNYADYKPGVIKAVIENEN